ncbi:MAG: 2-oxoacid:acceptor oxidoreductase family protein [candidate division KSB1 bacterium]|nr:2-oxoacid:acceptor oxidoreductase family protein [candidate division KSB1 bacterium]MDZ7385640.1 2-oxoacid:acceptor oxidoreductase family protein [candidate division KSB1 bacterium]MDZ7393163.1 2-oxoacid:acceptor oxidoreductase family protein [candidate division KSB1 bacterium]MDZ7412793.1 2-oxoacid:acceptor oxidoreductase family protein [candidate division KSB1 bacterium]
MRTEIRVSGYGGQGVILAGYIIGKATAIFEKKHATLTQSFGPEARGSACSAQVICSDEPIHYPYIRTPNILIAMSQEAYTKFEPELDPNGLLLIEEDLVKAKPPRDNIRMYAVPATRLAEQLGRRIVLNIVMLGFFTAVTNTVSKEAMEKAVLSSIPKGTEEINRKAFETGYEYGMKLLASRGEQRAASGAGSPRKRKAAAKE